MNQQTTIILYCVKVVKIMTKLPKYGINRTLVIKWVKDKSRIASAAESEIKKHLKIRPVRKYQELYVKLLKLFKEAWKKGHGIGFNIIWSKARTIQRNITNKPNAIVRKHVLENFTKRNNIRMRAKQRNKPLHKSEYTCTRVACRNQRKVS